ncbi:MAG TPA: cellulase family glycosylhydrolase [Bdellovibrionales bacterium]|nr:cellulase family glycosylhydrolase [Bdellovibrionales bacterium]
MSEIDNTFKALAGLGIKQFRFAFAWDGIETAPGKLDWGFWDHVVLEAKRHGITLIPYVCFTPAWAARNGENSWAQPPKDLAALGRFMAVIAARYRNEISVWELWNEPDNRHYWTGTAAEFSELIKIAAVETRKANPNALLVLGGFARADRFAEVALETHQLDRWVDVIAVHGYHETWEPEPVEEYAHKVAIVSNLIAQNRSGADLWFNEIGFSSKRGELAQAIHLWKQHAIILASEDVSLTAWYRIWDLPKKQNVIGDDHNRHLGLIALGGRAKPSLSAFRAVRRALGGSMRVLRSNELRVRGLGQGAQVYVFERADDTLVILGWLPQNQSKARTLTIEFLNHAPSGLRVITATGEPVESSARVSGRTLRGVRLQSNDLFIALLDAAVFHGRERIFSFNNIRDSGWTLKPLSAILSSQSGSRRHLGSLRRVHDSNDNGTDAGRATWRLRQSAGDKPAY